MKKLMFVGLLLLLAVMVQAQTGKGSYSFFSFTGADTLTITGADNVAGVTIWNPTSATDSVVVFGNAKTISGTAASSIKIAPGENLTIGNGQLPINYLFVVIRANSKPHIGTMTKISQ